MSKHTPGPWRISRDFVELRNHVSIDAENHYAIAEVVWLIDEDEADGKNSPEFEANARLIAAAPDLLETLQATQLLLERLGLESSDEYQRNAAAIAKATAEL